MQVAGMIFQTRSSIYLVKKMAARFRTLQP
ncbi:hypothetical protein [Anaerobutyricum hallii]